MPDAGVLVCAHRRDVDDHELYAEWLTDLATGDERFGCAETVLWAFVRAVTNRRVFPEPTPIEKALAFCEALRVLPTCVPIRPGPGHWEIFERLCRETTARGKLVADAYHAALAIEHGCEWVTTDADYARFRGLRWSHPLGGRG